MARFRPLLPRRRLHRDARWNRLRVAALGALLVGAARAETGTQRFLADTLDTRAGWDLEWDAGLDASAATSLGPSVSQQSTTLSAVRSFALGPTLALDGGLRSSLTAVSGAAAVGLPAHLQSDGLVLGATWKPAADWGLSVQTLPAVSGESGALSSRTLNVSGAVSGQWLVNERLAVQVGVEFDSLGRYAIYPEGGVVFDLTDALSLRLLFPQPRIIYQVSPAWAVYVGANEEVSSYRVGPNFGAGRGAPRLNHAALSLEETEFGPGTSYRWGEGVSVELNPGWVTERQDDYFRAGRAVDLKPAFALRLSVEISF